MRSRALCSRRGLLIGDLPPPTIMGPTARHPGTSEVPLSTC